MRRLFRAQMTGAIGDKSNSLFERFRGRGIRTRLLNPYDSYWDWKLGIRTFGYHPARGLEGDSDWKLHYTPTPYRDIFQLFRTVKLNSDDVFVDLGSGLGRAVFAASWSGARRAIGIEVVSSLCDGALSNLRCSQLRHRDVEFICDDALNYGNWDMTVLYMFHPFGDGTMRKVLANIEAARKQRQLEQLRIIYMNPVFDFVLEQSGWLERAGQIPPASRRFSSANSYVTSIWQSKD